MHKNKLFAVSNIKHRYIDLANILPICTVYGSPYKEKNQFQTEKV